MASTTIEQLQKQVENVERQIKDRTQASTNPEMGQIYQSLSEFTQLFKSMVEYERDHSEQKNS